MIVEILVGYENSIVIETFLHSKKEIKLLFQVQNLHTMNSLNAVIA